MGRRADHRLAVGGLGDHRTPRVDDQGAAIGSLPPGWSAELRGDEVALVLDRTRPQQRLPVVAPGQQRERGRDDNQLGAAQGEDPIKLGVADVEADRDADDPAVDLAVTISSPASSVSDSR